MSLILEAFGIMVLLAILSSRWAQMIGLVVCAVLIVTILVTMFCISPWCLSQIPSG